MVEVLRPRPRPRRLWWIVEQSVVLGGMALRPVTNDDGASIKTIERCDGALDGTVDDGHGLVRLYWIDL